MHRFSFEQTVKLVIGGLLAITGLSALVYWVADETCTDLDCG